MTTPDVEEADMTRGEPTPSSTDSSDSTEVTQISEATQNTEVTQITEITEIVQDRILETVRELKQEIKPKLRGWLHAGIVPLSLAAGIVLVALSPTTSIRIASAVFMVSALLLFSVSAIYHTGHWSPHAHGLLQRFDHANIFVLIAGSYTPFALLLLDNREATILLSIVWVGALFGVVFRVCWIGAPRWLYTPVYVALGWAAMFWMGDFVHARVAVFVLMMVGGGLYSLGGVVYGFKRPDPSPRWFGFHEVFHSLTIAAFIAHYVGISIATYSLR